MKACQFKKGHVTPKEICQKGGQVSAENRAIRGQGKRFAELIAEQLDMETTRGTTRKWEVAKKLVEMLEKGEKVDDVMKVFTTLRDTIGETVQQKVSVEQEKPFVIEVKVTDK